MNWDQIRTHWDQVCEKIKLTWGKLSENDLAAVAGRRDRLADRLQERNGLERVPAEIRVDDFARRLDP
jgi:uncharacterized protein YjbJ (UPF0337 family)